MVSFEGKVALVTGSGRGIGKGIALAFAAAGASVVVNGHSDAASLESVVEEISKTGSECMAIVADVGDPSEVDRLVEESLASFGKIDILVNNAGITHPAISFFDLDIHFIDTVFKTNFKGVYLCSRKVGDLMREQKHGCIINISSLAGVTPLPLAVYGPMKSAVNMLTRITARELAASGVRVNAIAPGYVLTPLVQKLIDEGQRDPSLLLDRVPMHEFIKPEDIADTALFLASDKARYINGEILVVDAGWHSDGGWSAYSGT
jgi:3-oxoacyl-[acyl-carrier protein] reductase